jgi:diadenosine tetraphosphate (Ap4A) HIT family hydrolase
MDIQPVNPGHVLVIPKRHIPSLTDLDPVIGGQVFAMGMSIAAALRASGLRCEGTNLFLPDGVAAGQEVFHTHLHVIPRYLGDGFGLKFDPGYFVLPERAALDEVAHRLRKALRS